MSAVFSIIVVTKDVNDRSLAAISQLENEHVELLVCTNSTGMFDAALLNAAVEQSSSEYTLILKDHQLAVSQEWLNLLANGIGENQLLGASGYSLLHATGVQLAAHARVEELAAVASSNQCVDPGEPVDAPVALSEEFLFSTSEFLRSKAFASVDFLAGGVSAGSFIGRYSLRMKLNNNSALTVIGLEGTGTGKSKKAKKRKKEIKSFYLFIAFAFICFVSGLLCKLIIITLPAILFATIITLFLIKI